jgi:hypothetical protein
MARVTRAIGDPDVRVLEGRGVMPPPSSLLLGLGLGLALIGALRSAWSP